MAPVARAALRLSPLAIGATLRVQDSLQAGHSRFFAEILRIRAIVELADGACRVLFLLDELLHGTNSHDRRLGAEAIVRALVDRGAIGLVTTHDLALAELTTPRLRRGERALRRRFENGRMTFDYRMRPGVVTRATRSRSCGQLDWKCRRQRMTSGQDCCSRGGLWWSNLQSLIFHDRRIRSTNRRPDIKPVPPPDIPPPGGPPDVQPPGRPERGDGLPAM